MLDFERIIEELKTPAAASLHARLRGAIEAQLSDGTLQPGDALPSERTLKEQLGISRATIRQAIKSLIDDGQLKSIVGAGTFVIEPQQDSSQNPLIGIIISESKFAVYYPELASSLSYELRNAGYRVDISIHNNRFETMNQVIASLLSQQVRAMVIVAPNQSGADQLIRDLRKKGIITILLTRYLENFKDFDYVGADNQFIGTEATRHLIDLGHTGILHVAGSGTSTAVDRATGYVQAMKKAGLQPQILISPKERGPLPPDLMNYMVTGSLTELWIRVARKEITAIFCFNDFIASWVQKEVRQLNLSIPRDLSLISVDNMPYAGFFDTPLTTFALPGEEIGKQAAALLLRRLGGVDFPPQRILIPATLNHRLSTTKL